MALRIPTRNDIVSKLSAYVTSKLPGLSPATKRRNWIAAMVSSLGSGMFDLYLAVKRYADKQTFPQSATGDFLFENWWVPITGLSRNPAAPSSGNVVVTGVNGTIIPITTEFTISNFVFNPTASGTIQSVVTPLNRLEYQTGLNRVVATSVDASDLANGMTVTIAGATDALFNGTFEITVLSGTEFWYQPTAAPITSIETGSFTGTADYAVLPVNCASTGDETNLNINDTGSFLPDITGADALALVSGSGISGGADIETEASFSARIVEALGIDYGMFTSAEISVVAKTVPGVTRVWVVEALVSPPVGQPAEGQVKIAFVRDNDSGGIFPDAAEIQDVRDAIDTIRPAHTIEADVWVESPTDAPVNFTIASLSPNTAGMQSAIRNSLNQFFTESTDYEEDITRNDYICAISNSYDSDTGQPIVSFTVSDPPGDVIIAVGELPSLGTVTFS